MSLIYQQLNYTLIVSCLFLILVVGISHGALDNIKGERLFKLLGYNSNFLFYFCYIFISLLIILTWLIIPNIILLIFLIVASYHFGKEDTVFSVKKNILLNETLYFLKDPQ